MSWRLTAIAAFGLLVALATARIGQPDSGGTASWDFARAAGFATFILLWLSVLCGQFLRMRFHLRPVPQTALLEFHRAVSTLSLAFLAGHLVALLVDPVVSFSVANLFVPFTSDYRPFATGLGVVSLWCLLTVLLSTAIAGRLDHARWRTLHLLSYPAYVLALAHGLLAGTDASAPWAMRLYVLSAASVAALTVLRLVAFRSPARAILVRTPGISRNADL
jgi:DMSO/TMAO reductase YedYZ heme-binding membrane subunit